MIAAFAAKSALSMKKEIGVVLVVIAVLLFMPAVAVLGMTSVGGLGDPGTSLYTGNASTTNSRRSWENSALRIKSRCLSASRW